MFHHFWIFYYVSPTKKNVCFRQNHNTTINIRQLTLICCSQLFHKPSARCTSCPSNVFNGQRTQFSTIRFSFIFMKKALPLSGSVRNLPGVRSKDLGPSHSHLVLFLVTNLERHCKVYRRKTPISRTQPLLTFCFSFQSFFLLAFIFQVFFLIRTTLHILLLSSFCFVELCWALSHTIIFL